MRLRDISALAVLPDYLDYNLKIVFVGYNPGERSACLGHHYAGRGNQFWRLLYDAGLTERLYRPEEDLLLLSLGYGLTNLAPRPSRSSSDLGSVEKKEGAADLRRKVAEYRPRLVCFLGKEVYRWYTGKRQGDPVEYGLVSEMQVFPDIAEYIAPNPSGRSTLPYKFKLNCFLQLRGIIL